MASGGRVTEGDEQAAGLREARRARIAVAAVFLTNGAVIANLFPRYPQLKDSLELSNTALGTAIAAFPLGALVAGLTASVLVGRFGSARVATFGMVVVAAATAAAGVAPSWAALAAVLFVAGAADSVVDVGQNAHALRVQRRYGRSILNSFHALWSGGAVLGGLLGSAAAGLAVPLAVHLTTTGIAFSVVALVGYRFMLPGPESTERAVSTERAGPARRPRGSRLAGVVLVLGLLAVAGVVVEDAGASWGAVYLSGSLGATAAVAGLAFVALQAMEFLGRMAGDRAVDRFGQRGVARAGGTLAAAGMGLALAFPTVGGTIAGFGLCGLGVATIVPAAFHAADELPGLPPGAGLTTVSWLLRVGFLASPPLVGLVADAVGLRAGLLVIPLAGVTIVACAATLPPAAGKAT